MNLMTMPMMRRLASWAPLILRLAVGAVFIAHGWQKLTGPTPTGIAGSMLKDWPVPIAWAWILTLTELVGGTALILGVLTRLSATLVSIIMLVVIFWQKLPNGGSILGTRGVDGAPGTPAFELELTLLAGALAIALLGAGKLSVDHMMGLDKESAI